MQTQIVFANPAFAKYLNFPDVDPDPDTLEVIQGLEEQIYENFQDRSEDSKNYAHYDARWIDLTGEGVPALFVLPVHLCGASNCTIIGFEERDGEWVKIYELFGGEGLDVKTSKTNGYFDIQQYRGLGAARGFEIESHWNGEKYVTDEAREIKY